MRADDKRLAELVLQHLVVDTRIVGLRFGPPIQVLLDSERDPGQSAYLNLESPWTLFANASAARWALQNLTTARPEEAQFATICSIRGRRIVSATLSDEAPHLMLGLDSGGVLGASGIDDHYECWQVGSAHVAPAAAAPANDLPDATGKGAVVYPADADHFFLVVAGVAGALTVWCPPGWAHSSKER